MLKCMMAPAPMQLMVIPVVLVLVDNKPMANMMNFAPMVNVLPSPSPCQILTASACGVPVPCLPATVAPFIPHPTVYVGSPANLAIKVGTKTFCAIGGMIENFAIAQWGILRELK